MTQLRKLRRSTPPSKHDIPACPVTRKLSFTSRAKARKRQHKRGGAATEAYLCEHCGYWHTATPLRKKHG